MVETTFASVKSLIHKSGSFKINMALKNALNVDLLYDAVVGGGSMSIQM